MVHALTHIDTEQVRFDRDSCVLWVTFNTMTDLRFTTNGASPGVLSMAHQDPVQELLLRENGVSQNIYLVFEKRMWYDGLWVIWEQLHF